MFTNLTTISLLLIAAYVQLSSAVKVVLTNDDGWATAQIRAQYEALTAAGYDVSPSGLQAHYFKLTWLACLRLYSPVPHITNPEVVPTPFLQRQQSSAASSIRVLMDLLELAATQRIVCPQIRGPMDLSIDDPCLLIARINYVNSYP